MATPGDSEATVPQARLQRASIELPTLRLCAVRGPSAGAQLLVEPASPPRLYIGKSSASDLVLADREVSRRHAAVELTPGGLRVTDLDSTNGTWINGLSVTSAVVRGGEVIRVGATELAVEAVGEAARVRFPPVESFGRVLGASTAMRRLYPILQRLAAASVPLVIEGATGTGKELVAEAIHEAGPRREQPFVVFDFHATDAKRVDAVLFGEEGRGRSRRPGVFEEASGGTLLIDEIGDLPLVVQAKLLRVLETNEVRPVDGDRWIPVDTRVIAVTARDLERAVEAGRFREDLYFRLVGGRVSLPPLREREGDVELLARHFWAQVAPDTPMPDELLAPYVGYAWPGNVRELSRIVERAALLGDAARDGGDEPPTMAPAMDDAFARVLEKKLPLSAAREQVVAAFERAYVARALADHGGNVTRAAAASGVARRYFHTLLARHRAG